MNMSQMNSSMSGPNLLPAWVDVVWIIALSAVLIFHCRHWLMMNGQHRWFHSTHILMIVGMIYMFASMAWSWDWIAGPAWMVLYAAVSLAIIGWMLIRFVRKQPFSFLWILALVQQGAMIYMFAPMGEWVAGFSFALAYYFLIETLAWLLGMCDDNRADRGFAFGPGDRSQAVPLNHGTTLGNISMAVMAGSMSYMFLGMQLMM